MFNILSISDSVEDEYFKRNFAWHAITYSVDDHPDTICNCKNATIVLVKPDFNAEFALNPPVLEN